MDANTETQRRRLAHLVAEIIGLVVGIPLFLVGLKGVFVIGVNDNLLTILAGISGWLMLLPLTLLGFSRPRAAAWGVIASLGVFLVGLLGQAISSPGNMESSLSGMLKLLFFFILPFGAVARLLFYASEGNAHEEETNS